MKAVSVKVSDIGVKPLTPSSANKAVHAYHAKVVGRELLQFGEPLGVRPCHPTCYSHPPARRRLTQGSGSHL